MSLREQIRNFILDNFMLENPEDLVDDESMLEKGSLIRPAFSNSLPSSKVLSRSKSKTKS